MHCSSEDKEHKALVMKTPDQKIEHILQRMLADRSTDAPADTITWAVTRPHHVNVDLLVLRPRAQASNTKVHREL